VRFVGLAMTKSEARKGDINLIQPLVEEMIPTLEDKSLLEEVSPRPFLAGFKGKPTCALRKEIYALTPPKGIKTDIESAVEHHSNRSLPLFKALLASYTFGLAPKGDCHYSFRLAETIAFGGVPVLIDDEMAPIYVPGGVKMSEWAVIVEEKDVSTMLQTLSEIPKARIEEMKKAGEAVKTCYESMKGLVTCMLDGLESLQVINCNATNAAVLYVRYDV
jgi:hypothetical protein